MSGTGRELLERPEVRAAYLEGGGTDGRGMGTLCETESWLQVLFVTGILGGGAAWLTGRACAHTWRPLLQVIAYIDPARRGRALLPLRAVRGGTCCRSPRFSPIRSF